MIEVALFLALTGLLFVGIIMGTGNSIAQQRFFDSTQSFAEFLRSVYSQVSNVEGVEHGRSEQAIYGKMISFGQDYDLTGDAIGGGAQKIFVYDVVGDADGLAIGGTVANALAGLNANVAVATGREGNVVTGMTVAGIAESYEPRWGATIEQTESRNEWAPSDENLYTGTILVVRHPVSGTINTLVSPEVIPVNRLVVAESDYDEAQKMLLRVLCAGAAADDATCQAVNAGGALPEERKFQVKEVNFCVNPGGLDYEAPLRWNIRLIANARNASGVETIDRDDFDDTDGDGKNECER